VLAVTKEGQFALVPVTVTDGPLPWPGNQLKVDTDDFPTLAKTGLHAAKELDRLKTITGKPVAEITELGRPGRASTAGFLAEDEAVVSVLKGDNALVARMRLTHPKLARPLFHVWNLVREHRQLFEHIVYNDQRVLLYAAPTPGLQTSIFNDEMLGGWNIFVWRELAADERKFLEARYSNLGPEKMDELAGKLSRLRVGDMEAYYIMRYGFYEGHTLWRADPIAIAFIFGLRSLEELEKAFPGCLYRALTDHHTKGGDIK